MGFFLLSLHPNLLEKILTKTKPASYFALQQTCHAVNELVQNSRNVSVHIGGEYSVEFDNSPSYLIRCQLYQARSNLEERVDWAGRYGTRLGKLQLPHSGGEGKFKPLCEFLKKYRLMCDELILYDHFWNKEECTQLIKQLKPVRIDMLSYQGPSTRFEALFTARTVKSAEICINPDDGSRATRELLPLLQELEISVMDTPDHFDLLRSALQILRSTNWPNLRKFSFSVLGSGPPSTDQFEREFLDVEGVSRLVDTADEFLAVVELPQDFPETSSCKITVTGRMYSIYYEVNEDLEQVEPDDDWEELFTL